MFVGYAGGTGRGYGLWGILAEIGNAVFGSWLARKVLARRTRGVSYRLMLKIMPQYPEKRYSSFGFNTLFRNSHRKLNSHNRLHQALQKNLNNEKSSLIIKVLCVIFVICSYIIANTDTAFLDMMSYSWGIISGSFLAPYVVSLFRKKMNTKGAWAGIISEFTVAIIPAIAKLVTYFTANEAVAWL